MLRLYVKSIFLHNIMVTVIHFSPVNREDFQLKECMSAKITVCLTSGRHKYPLNSAEAGLVLTWFSW